MVVGAWGKRERDEGPRQGRKEGGTVTARHGSGRGGRGVRCGGGARGVRRVGDFGRVGL